jgi:hypothetical protein
MNIVPFTFSHYDDVWLMGLEFLGTTRYAEATPNYDDVFQAFEACARSGLSFVAETDVGPVGMILAVDSPLWINSNIRRSTELMWWVDEEYRNSTAGVRLIQAYEKAVEERGIEYTGMTLLSTSSVGLTALLGKRGYSCDETQWTKENK